MKTKTYITTAIPYVNAQPHVGFALELVQADAIARWHRRSGASVWLQTGTDENAFKNVEAARAAGVDTRTWVDTCAKQFRQLADDLRIDYRSFLRTAEPNHQRAVHTLWQSIRSGDIYVKSYNGLYCSGCEDFLFEKDLIAGRCPDHQQPPVVVSETNYFFRLSAYQEAIERWLASGAVRIRPEKRRNEIVQFVRAGLQDISISRLAVRSGGWGVPVPGDATQVVYVWIDALVNYLTGLGYGTNDDWRAWWSSDTLKIHVIGRNVWKFHAVYWPALLLSAGLPLPDELVIHGFLTTEGRKIGKSLGNAIAPEDYIRRYGVDAVRYFLLRVIPPFDDGDFSSRRFALAYHADLANGIGNLLSRLLTLAVRSGLDEVTLDKHGVADAEFTRSAADYRHDEAISGLWKEIAALNGEVERAKPWVALQQGHAAVVRVQIAGWLSRVAAIARELETFLPDTSVKILNLLGKRPLTLAMPLFPRI